MVKAEKMLINLLNFNSIQKGGAILHPKMPPRPEFSRGHEPHGILRSGAEILLIKNIEATLDTCCHCKKCFCDSHLKGLRLIFLFLVTKRRRSPTFNRRFFATYKVTTLVPDNFPNGHPVHKPHNQYRN